MSPPGEEEGEAGEGENLTEVGGHRAAVKTTCQ